MKRKSSCRISRRKTNISDDFIKKVNKINAIYQGGKSIYEMGNLIHRGLRWVFSKANDVDTKKALEASTKMQNKLIDKGLTKNNPIFKDFKNLDKTLRSIEWLDKQGETKLKAYQIEVAKKLYKKLYKKYNKIITA